MFILILEIIQFGDSEDYKRKSAIRKIIEAVLEGLPSTVKQYLYYKIIITLSKIIILMIDVKYPPNFL